MKNKKGISTLGIFILIFAVFIIVVILGIYGLIFQNINNYLTSLDVTVGAANLTEAVNDTFGKISDSYLNSVDYLAYFMIFSLILFMFINAYYTRGKYPQIMIIVDIILLVFYYIAAVYVSNTYLTFINSSSFLDIYSDYLNKSSKLVLRLPLIIGIVGVIMIILSYSKIPKDTDEQLYEYGSQ